LNWFNSKVIFYPLHFELLVTTTYLYNMFSNLMKYFLRGLLLIGPLALTIFVIYKVLNFSDGLITEHLPFSFPGMGLLIILPGIAMLGFLGGTVLVSPFTRSFNKLIKKAPFLKVIYDSIKDLMSAFVGQKKKFNQPVLVKMNESAELYKLGYITEENLSELKIDESLIAVYLPHSYNFSGNLYILPSKNVKKLDYNSGKLMKFIVSGGVTSLSQELEE
jgi:uncharacterized membrane protein